MTGNGIDNPKLFNYFNPEWKAAMLTNHSGTTRGLAPSRKILNGGIHLELLLSPEHGLFGAEQAGVKIADEKDAATGVPCRPTYGEGNAMTEESIRGLDAFICDLQDVGSRFYTYLYTMADAMALCAKCGVKFFILDRINPINGRNTEGVRIEEECSSFVGRYGIPTRYGLTLGEFARMVNEKANIGCDLTVIPCTGWTRDMEFEDTGLSWVNPSPNIPTPDCARIYCGTCIFEGTNFSEGRGTTHPFETVGAPYLDTAKVLKKLETFHLPGVAFRECRFLPVFGKFTNELCYGFQIHVTDRKTFNGFESGFRLLQTLMETTPEFKFNSNPDNVEELIHFDCLLGTKNFRLGKIDPEDFIRRARKESAEFREEVRKYHLY